MESPTPPSTSDASPTTDASAPASAAERDSGDGRASAASTSGRTVPRKTAAAAETAPRVVAAKPAARKPAPQKPTVKSAGKAAGKTTGKSPEKKTPAKPAARRPTASRSATTSTADPSSSTAAAPQKAPAPRPRIDAPVLLRVEGLRKSFSRTVAVDGIALSVRRGEIFGFVGPNGAGKTTTLSMMTGLLRPDAGTVTVGDADVWGSPGEAKRVIGVLPDRMRLFDRLTGAQMLYYCGVLHGLDRETARSRSDDLSRALALDGALDRPVADYSIGMIKKVSLAAALIHSPRLLVLDEPFEGVDPVSTAHAIDLLRSYARAGGTVVLSSHNMDLVERVCDAVAVIVGGSILAEGSLDEVRQGSTLEERFVELAGGRGAVEGLEWLTTFSD